MLNRIKSRRGFSLIELAVVLIVIAVIAAIAIPTFQKVIEKSEASAAKASVEAVGRNAVALAAFDRVDAYSMLSEAVAEATGVTQGAGTDTELDTSDDVLTFDGHAFTLTISGSKVTAVPVS